MQSPTRSFCFLLKWYLLLLASSLVIISSAHAAWFSATGQAMVINGDKERAKSEATQEAIKQALLFAGASVTSVQQMTNGLLLDDHLEIRASGEVNNIELIDEVYSDGFVTVSIRADIFSQTDQCSGADYTKRIATTHFPIAYPAQASDGQIHQLGDALGERFGNMFNRVTTSMSVTNTEPYAVNWEKTDSRSQSKILANKTNVQYVLGIVIKDVSIERKAASHIKIWRSDESIRSFGFDLHFFDGASGEKLLTKSYNVAAPWSYAFTESVDVYSDMFWRSPYGKAIEKSVQKAVIDLEERTRCEPTMGRILAVANNQLQINLGQNQQVQAGDQLTLFSVKEIQDTFGQSYRQFMLHPTTLVVSRVYPETATVTSIDGSLLANIQPNDYVARQ